MFIFVNSNGRVVHIKFHNGHGGRKADSQKAYKTKTENIINRYCHIKEPILKFDFKATVHPFRFEEEEEE